MTHFGHSNICKGCSDWEDKSSCRDFSSIEDHDNYLIDRINKFVKPTDTLRHLGDLGLGFAWKDKLKEIRQRIKCENISLILGNHDHVIENSLRIYKRLHEEAIDGCLNTKQMEAKDIVQLFKSIDYLKFGKIGGHPMCLCHYAMKIWPWSHQGSYHLYGHSHGNLAEDGLSLSMDVGMDTCLYGHEKYTPYSFEEIDHIMKNYKKFIPIDHHKIDHHKKVAQHETSSGTSV